MSLIIENNFSCRKYFNMTIPSISQTENPIDENVRTAIFYSISDIGEYLVEIRHHNQQYFISHGTDPDRFGNLGEAKRAALKQHAEQAYLALDKTYEEVEVSTSTTAKPADQSRHFDYVPVTLNNS